MLIHPTLDKLRELRLTGMQKALIEQMDLPDRDALTFDERFGLLVDCEYTDRENRRLKTRLKRARLRQAATIEDIDYRHPRGLDKSLMLCLAGCDWIRQHHNVILTGPTGAGKSYLACALGNKACREGYPVLYFRIARLFQDLAIAKVDGRYDKLLRALARAQLLVLDDWGTAPLTDEQRRDLFEVMEDRYDRGSTLIAAQLPVKHWHETIGDPTLADAILDRLIHNAYTITLKGESMRKRKTKDLTTTKPSGKKNKDT
ncbi:MAG: ATP-binding protein [bacterium]|nr:ATP-binding protein [bacterium]